jgi:enoyl-CoA hydratase/carnithine racemase
MALSTEMVLYEKRDRVAYVTINRPEAMNALSSAVNRGLNEAWMDFRDDPDMLVAILTGAGGRAFSAGADLKEVNERQSRGLSGFEQGGAGSRYIPDLGVWKPIIAAIDGYCVAGGLELAMQCDIRIATEASQFGLPEPRWSILPAYGLHYLTRMVPMGEALYIMLTGSRISAAEAHRIGLIHSVHPDRDSLMAAAQKIAEEVKLCAPLALQVIKQTAYIGKSLPPEYSHKLADELSKRVQGTEDALEGPRAFTERRTPQWKGR